MANDDDDLVSGPALARVIGVSERSVADLARRGIVERAGRGQYRLEPSVRRYCEELRRTASARGGEASLAKVREERHRLLAAQAAAVEIKNRKAASELVEAAELEREWSAILQTVRAGMLAVSSRVGARLGHLTAADVATIEAEVREVLTETGRGDIVALHPDGRGEPE